MSDREDDPAAHELLDSVLHSVDLRGGSDHAHADRVVVALTAHEPVLSDGEVLRAIDLLERLELVLRGEEELGRMRAALRELDERALGVPAEEGRRVRRGVRAEEVQDLRVERALLGLWGGRTSVNGFLLDTVAWKASGEARLTGCTRDDDVEWEDSSRREQINGALRVQRCHI